jgi:hypothetical protein
LIRRAGQLSGVDGVFCFSIDGDAPTALALKIVAATYSTSVFNREQVADRGKLRPLLLSSLGAGVALIGGAGITLLENVLLPMRAAGKMSERKCRSAGSSAISSSINLSSGDAILPPPRSSDEHRLIPSQASQGIVRFMQAASPTVACRLAQSDELYAIKIEPNRK